VIVKPGFFHLKLFDIPFEYLFNDVLLDLFGGTLFCLYTVKTTVACHIGTFVELANRSDSAQLSLTLDSLSN